jgi:3-methyladenine DNA glycosylase AlkC
MCTGARDIPSSLVRRKLWQTEATSSLASYPLLPGDDQGPLIHTILETDSDDLEVRALVDKCTRSPVHRQ